MSEVGTLGNIFIEPGNTFEDLRRKPRFILAGLILIFLTTAFQILLIEKIGFEKLTRARLESSSQIQQLPEADKQKMVEQQSSPMFKYITYGVTPIVVILLFSIGALIYWLGSMAMGGSADFCTHFVSLDIFFISACVNILN